MNTEATTFAAIEQVRRAITADIERALLEAKAINAFINGREEALRHLDIAEQALHDGGTFGMGMGMAPSTARRGRPRLLPDATPPVPVCRHLHVEPVGDELRSGGYECWRCEDCGTDLGASAALRDTEKSTGRE